MNTARRPLADRFWEQVCPEPNSGCWLWTGAVRYGGYGQIGEGGRGGKILTATHVALRLAGIALPPGMSVLHKCDVPLCVNPDHLFVGTQKNNIDDMHQKNRAALGEKHGRSVLTWDRVDHIRAQHPQRSMTELAEANCVSISTISMIVREKLWKRDIRITAEK